MKTSTLTCDSPQFVIPENGNEGTWVGRAWIPENLTRNGLAGPRVVLVQKNEVFDLSAHFSTMAELVNAINPVAQIRKLTRSRPLLSLDQFLAQSLFTERNASLTAEKNIVLLAPNDLQAIKACGVTFVKSLLERVVEEKARGNPAQASRSEP